MSGAQQIRILPGPGPWIRPRVSLASMSGAGGITTTSSLRQDASFEFEGVASGSYQILVEQGIMPTIVWGSVEVQVGNHDVKDVSITVHAPHSLKGTVKLDEDDKTLPEGLSLWLDSPDGRAWEASTAPCKDGSFSFDSVPSGRYRVHVRAGTSRRYYVKHLRYGGVDATDPTFSVSSTEETLDVTLSSRGATVKGAVLGNALPGSAATQVVLLPDTADSDSKLSETHLGVLDQLNAFAVKDVVRPGGYTAYAFQGVPDGAWTDPEFIKGVESKGVRVAVAEGDVKVIEVPLIPQADLAALLVRLGMN